MNPAPPPHTDAHAASVESDPRRWDDAQWAQAAAQLQEEATQLQAQSRALAVEHAPWGAAAPTANQIRSLYDQARGALQEGRYAPAALDFAVLSDARPSEPRFFFGMGLSLQMMGHLDHALKSYAAAYMLDARDPACLLRIGECLLMQGEREQAREAWLLALKLCDMPGGKSDLRPLIHASLDRVAHH